MGRVKAAGEAAAGGGAGTAALTTAERLVAAALALLDAGGEEAVTMRAVGHACGLSHNASYKHFKSRKALLAAVATAEFSYLSQNLEAVLSSKTGAEEKLTRALDIIIEYNFAHPARYKLLFVADPGIVGEDEELRRAAGAAFATFRAIVSECQADWGLPAGADVSIAGLMLATLQGLVAQEANGRINADKGQIGVRAGMNVLVRLLSRS
ncbi:TetR/AcrR family transcriptional regulator [Pelagibacterium sp. 26DY04]|uniref:TetR/AcrR family transcriptional regulator n=1 Tax=Pelagibacterium sp. 26DY04 TaxID=2967130 RepID=UPI0028160EB0|nr:TetR/AcrR family transcriptional regulator [Pelagibacterium sp. 26DY04]WMT88732.1 TetR/AcrR family transcriptional regulator [Pelagibacterium sp. 26DY04]